MYKLAAWSAVSFATTFVILISGRAGQTAPANRFLIHDEYKLIDNLLINFLNNVC